MKYKITIEDSEGHKVVLNCANVSLSQEMGIRQTVSADGTITSQKPNNQHRILVKGWTGCDSYEDFKAESREGK